MNFYIIILLACVIELKGAKLNNKKTSKSVPQSAIIAIQIIDPHENKTSSKGSKRTIDSSLGYGYQTIFGGKQLPPRYETYKYSQHDIPPYSGSPPVQYTSNVQSQSYEIQPSVSKQIYATDVSSHYQPGTVLFSTIDQQGQLGGLSSQFPGSLENHQFPIPVIILRVHPNQLANPVYPKLPQNHYLSSQINSIDINSLLSNYIRNNLKQNPAPEYQQQYQQPQAYAQPETMDYQTSDYQSQQYYPQYQYEDTQQSNQQQNYQSHQQESNLPEPRSPGIVPKYAVSEVSQSAPIYEQHLPPYQQPAAPVNDFRTPELLTHENYPSEKHTRVIFKRAKGKRRNANKTYRPARVQATKSYTQPQETQVQPDEASAYNTKYTNTNSYNSVRVQSSKPQVAPEDDQIEDNKISEYDSKYAAPNSYYTQEYPQDQQHDYKNAPRYEDEPVSEMYQNVQPETQYIYVSSQPRQPTENA